MFVKNLTFLIFLAQFSLYYQLSKNTSFLFNCVLKIRTDLSANEVSRFVFHVISTDFDICTYITMPELRSERGKGEGHIQILKPKVPVKTETSARDYTFI